jgi:integrase
MAEIQEKAKRKRSGNKYWRTVKGHLYARFQYNDESGKIREKLKPLTDKRNARAVVEGMRRELETHGEETLQADKVTFKDLAEKYKKAKVFPAVIRDGIKVSGLKSHKPVETYVKIASLFFGKKRIRSIKPSDIEKFKQERLNTLVERVIKEKISYTDEKGKKKNRYEKKTKTSTRKVSAVNRELATLRAMLNFAEEEGWLIKNPFPAKIISFSAERERERILSHNEESQLLAQCKDERTHIKPILICALDTAMRPDEIFKLRWDDIDFDLSTITVRIENSKVERARNVWMSSRLKDELKKLWNVSPKDSNLSVFGTKSIKKAFKTACRLAGIEGFRFRDARHTATTRMILAGYSHAEVMKVTGHTQMKTFLRYLNLTPEVISEKATRMDAFLILNQKQIEEVSESVN